MAHPAVSRKFGGRVEAPADCRIGRGPKLPDLDAARTTLSKAEGA